MFGKLFRSLTKNGVTTTCYKTNAYLYDYFFDYKYNLETARTVNLTGLTVRGANVKDAVRYEPTRVLPLHRLFRYLKPMMPDNGVFVDFGCGKGRVLIVAAENGCGQVRGVEFAPELAEIAERNFQSFRLKSGIHANCEVFAADALEYELKSDEQVYFLFNPFKNETMSKLLQRINQSLEAHPRKLIIVYHNPKCDHLFASLDHLTLQQKLDFSGYIYHVYTNF